MRRAAFSGVYAAPPADGVPAYAPERSAQAVCAAGNGYKKHPKPMGFGCFFAEIRAGGQKKALSGAAERLTARENFDIMRRLYWEDGRKHIPTFI